MRVTVVGSGGREHALAWRLIRSESIEEVTIIPGNAGIARETGCVVVSRPATLEEIVRTRPDFVVVGPEGPLVDGLGDSLRDAGIPVVGPSRAAAILEGSKATAKEFMVASGVPTTEFYVCRSPVEAREAVIRLGAPVAVKADGLAGGKGVVVCSSLEEAEAAIHSIMDERLFGEAGDVVVVERAVEGSEASVTVAIDESGYLLFPTALDHKRVGDGDRGPNTAGMGAIAPNPRMSDEILSRIEHQVIEPTVEAIRTRGWLYRGFLFFGLMFDDRDIYLLDYNVRFGDPEAQAILPLVGGDFGVLLHGLSGGQLAAAQMDSSYSVMNYASSVVVAAAEGYPGLYRKGDAIEGDVGVTAEIQESRVYYAGVDEIDRGQLVTAGGRVLAVGAIGADLAQARTRAYQRMLAIRFDGMQFRRDIGGADLTHAILEEGAVLIPRFEKRGGLLPVVVQDDNSDQILMVGYTNRAALDKTRATGLAWFWSTSRGRLWQKGETSGNTLAIREIRIDCDQDALVYRVVVNGTGVCHTTNVAGDARQSCFYRTVLSDGSLINSEP